MSAPDRSEKQRQPASPPTCKGHSYHVFTLGSERCSVCGWNRYKR